MKYFVDPALCCAHGQCYAVAPEVFTAGDDGFNADTGKTVKVPAHLDSAARAGADSCPESAILKIDMHESG